MGHSIGVAHDPSVADYRATSPRCAQGGTKDLVTHETITMFSHNAREMRSH